MEFFIYFLLSPPVGVNPDRENMRVSAEGAGRLLACLCVDISSPSRVEPRMDKDTRPLDKTESVQLSSLGLYLGCAGLPL